MAEFAFFIQISDGFASVHKALIQGWITAFSREESVTFLADESGTTAGNIDHFSHQVAVYPGGKVIKIEVEIINAAGEFGGKVIAQVLRVKVIQIMAGIDKGAT